MSADDTTPPTAYDVAVATLTQSLTEYGPASAAVVASAAIVNVETARGLRADIQQLAAALTRTAAALASASRAFGEQKQRKDRRRA